jgi:hypothetical protein
VDVLGSTSSSCLTLSTGQVRLHDIPVLAPAKVAKTDDSLTGLIENAGYRLCGYGAQISAFSLRLRAEVLIWRLGRIP